MKPDELRDQAKRWRERAPGQAEPEVAEALVEAAGSLESLADEKEKKDGTAAAAPKPADKKDGKPPAAPKPAPEFIHRAYEPKKPG